MRIRSFLAVVIAALLLTTGAGAVSLEQVQPIMPQIDVYIRDGDTDLQTLALEDITATMDDVPLQVELMEPSEQGIFYVFLLDISRSISEAHISAARQAVMNTYRQMGPSDQLALISFGNEVNVLLRGGENADQVQAALDTIHSTDNNTRFYDAMNTLIETASTQDNMRKVAVVVSDGVDDTDAGMTRNELVTILRQSGVAVYAMAVDSTNESVRNQFRDFIQVSGGDLVSFSPSNADAKLAELQESIDEIWHLQLQAPSNIADSQNHKLDIRFGELDTLSTDIRPTNWIPDNTPPSLVSSVTDAAAGTVTITFSEAIANSTDPACYILKDSSGKEMDFTLSSPEPNQVVLKCAEMKNPAGWTLSVQNLKDASMEANLLTPYNTQLAEAQIEAPAETPEEAPVTAPAADSELVKLLLPVGGALLLILLLVLLLVAKSRKKDSSGRGKREKKEKVRRSFGSKNSGVTFFFENDDSKKNS